MKNLLNLMVVLSISCLALAAKADGGPECGQYDWFGPTDPETGLPPFVFTGDLGFTQWDQGQPHHDVTPTFSASGTVGANTPAYNHVFDISPDGEDNVVWQLKACLRVEDVDGNWAVFGSKRYFEVVDNAYIFDSQHEDYPIAANHFDDLYQPQVTLNFYTADNANQSTNDYVNAVLAKYGEGAITYEFVASWTKFVLPQ